MPRGGHNAKPTKLKVIEGTFRPDRAPTNEPRPDPIAPACPSSLDQYAKELWQRLSPKLEKLGLFTEVDGEMFAAMCEAWARWEHARRRLAEILKQKEVQLRQLRLAEISVERAEHSFRLLGSEFGLAPGSRSRMNIRMGDEDDEFEEFLSGAKRR